MTIVKTSAPILSGVTISEGEGVRYLHLETPWVQGAMRKSAPLKLELDYIQRMMAWLLLQEPIEWANANTLHLGMGAAALTKYCHRVLKVPTTVVEINPLVIAACKTYFHLSQEDDRLTIVQEDAGTFVSKLEYMNRFNVICVDLYDQEAASPVLDDEGFYRDCHQVLCHGGVMTMNLFGRSSSFASTVKRIQFAFGFDRVAAFKPTREGNTVVLAWKGFDLPGRDVLIERSEAIEARYDLPAKKWVNFLSPCSYSEP